MNVVHLKCTYDDVHTDSKKSTSGGYLFGRKTLSLERMEFYISSSITCCVTEDTNHVRRSAQNEFLGQKIVLFGGGGKLKIYLGTYYTTVCHIMRVQHPYNYEILRIDKVLEANMTDIGYTYAEKVYN